MVDLYAVQDLVWCMQGYSDPLSISQQNFLYEMDVNVDWKLYRSKSFTWDKICPIRTFYQNNPQNISDIAHP